MESRTAVREQGPQVFATVSHSCSDESSCSLFILAAKNKHLGSGDPEKTRLGYSAGDDFEEAEIAEEREKNVTNQWTS